MASAVIAMKILAAGDQQIKYSQAQRQDSRALAFPEC